MNFAGRVHGGPLGAADRCNDGMEFIVVTISINAMGIERSWMALNSP